MYSLEKRNWPTKFESQYHSLKICLIIDLAKAKIDSKLKTIIPIIIQINWVGDLNFIPETTKSINIPRKIMIVSSAGKILTSKILIMRFFLFIW